MVQNLWKAHSDMVAKPYAEYAEGEPSHEGLDYEGIQAGKNVKDSQKIKGPQDRDQALRFGCEEVISEVGEGSFGEVHVWKTNCKGSREALKANNCRWWE